MINYQLRMGKNFKVILSVGVYYGFGIGGKFKGKYGSDFAINCYGFEGLLKRSDLGVCAAAGFAWKQYSLTDWGLTNIAKESAQQVLTRGTKFKNRAFTFSLGYNF